MRLRSFFRKLGVSGRFGAGAKGQTFAPPVLKEAVRFPYGPFRWKTQLAEEKDYTVMASPDLRTWLPVLEGRTHESPIEYVDPDASKFAHRFYRLLVGDIYSVNIVGFAAISLPPDFSMIANPFDSSDCVAETFKNWPEGTSLSRFDTRMFRLVENVVRHGKWSNPGEKLLRGEGVIFYNPTSDYKTGSFVGDVAQDNSSIPIPSGFSLRGSIIPQAGSLADDLRFPIANGDVVHLFDRDKQSYQPFPYVNDKWSAGQPVLGVGEAFWVAKNEPRNWACDLVIG